MDDPSDKTPPPPRKPRVRTARPPREAVPTVPTVLPVQPARSGKPGRRRHAAPAPPTPPSQPSQPSSAVTTSASSPTEALTAALADVEKLQARLRKQQRSVEKLVLALSQRLDAPALPTHPALPALPSAPMDLSPSLYRGSSPYPSLSPSVITISSFPSLIDSPPPPLPIFPLHVPAPGPDLLALVPASVPPAGSPPRDRPWPLPP